MTLDEAIKHCLEVAEHNEYLHKRGYAGGCNSHDCLERAIIHRQLAELLMELKQWRRVYGICPSYEMCIPECKEGYNAQIAEYKRLLKAAVEDFRWLESHTEDEKGHCCISGDNNELACIHCPLNQRNKDTFMCGWNYEAEALALIGEDGDTND